jgi:hypothetical protein
MHDPDPQTQQTRRREVRAPKGPHATGEDRVTSIGPRTDHAAQRAAAMRGVVQDLEPKLRELAVQLGALANVLDKLNISSLFDVCELVRRDRDVLERILGRPLENGQIPPWWSQ